MKYREDEKNNQIIFKNLSNRISSKIEDEYYLKYSVKRGLRNADGTGVLVGLTEIGDVRSYLMCEGEKIPMEGKLLYRGLDIMDLADGFQKEGRFGFEECCYLLLFGELPNQGQLEEFENLLSSYRELPYEFTENHILKAPSNNLMNKIARSVLTLYSYDDNPDDTSIENIIRQSIQLISRIPVLATYGYQAKRHYYEQESLFIHRPQKNLSTAENILHLTRPDSKYSRLEAELLDLALVLHAEHGGGNNSTFTTHVISSTGTDTYSAIAGAIGSLKGPLHGGANAMVLDMMEDFKSNINNWESEDEVAAYVEKVLRKEAFDHTGLIYGMGHAVYTISDPRALLLKEKAAILSKEKGMEKEYHLYQNIERVTPDIFKRVKENDKVVCANVDFYSGFVYNMLNIPKELHTPIFVIARIAGWSAHRMEEIISGGRIIRPAYKNVAKGVEYTPMNERI